MEKEELRRASDGRSNNTRSRFPRHVHGAGCRDHGGWLVFIANHVDVADVVMIMINDDCYLVAMQYHMDDNDMRCSDAEIKQIMGGGGGNESSLGVRY